MEKRNNVFVGEEKEKRFKQFKGTVLRRMGSWWYHPIKRVIIKGCFWKIITLTGWVLSGKETSKWNDYKQLEFSHWIGAERGKSYPPKKSISLTFLSREFLLLLYTPFQRLPCPPPHGQTLIYGIIMMVQRNYYFTHWVINMKLGTETLSGAEKIKEKFSFVLERKNTR